MILIWNVRELRLRNMQVKMIYSSIRLSLFSFFLLNILILINTRPNHMHISLLHGLPYFTKMKNSCWNMLWNAPSFFCAWKVEVKLKIKCSIVKMTDVLRTRFNNENHSLKKLLAQIVLMIEFVPFTYLVANGKKIYHIVSHLNFQKTGLKYQLCCSFIVPFYHIY